MSQASPIGIISCPSGQKLTDQIVANLQVNHQLFYDPVVKTRTILFPNGEIKVELEDSVRHLAVYIIQDLTNHENVDLYNKKAYNMNFSENLLNLFITIHTCLSAGCQNISVVLPYYPYSRQDRKKTREGLTAAMSAQILESMDIKYILTLDLHSPQIVNAFRRTQLINFYSAYNILEQIATLVDIHDPNLVIVAPDTGSLDRSKFMATNIHKPLALLYKERDYSKVPDEKHKSNINSTRLLGNVEGKITCLIDDMLDTGTTILLAMETLRKMGAKKVLAAVSLPLFSGSAIEDFDQAWKQGVFDYIIGTNGTTVPTKLLNKTWFKQADVSDTFAQAIWGTYTQESLSRLLDSTPSIQNLLNREKNG